MGKISFPKHISQGRRLLRNSPRQLGAPAVGMRRARLSCQGARRAQHQPGHKSQAVPGTAGTRMLREKLCPATCTKAGEEKPRQSVDGSGLGAAQGSGPSGSALPGPDRAPGGASLAKLRAHRPRREP